jgi:hypothetical protein
LYYSFLVPIGVRVRNNGETFHVFLCIALFAHPLLPTAGPLYRVVAYDAVCFNGNEGFYYVALTQFCNVVFAMIMVTLRVAFKPSVIDEPHSHSNVALKVPGAEYDHTGGIDIAQKPDGRQQLDSGLESEVAINFQDATHND